MSKVAHAPIINGKLSISILAKYSMCGRHSIRRKVHAMAPHKSMKIQKMANKSEA
jgi:hypothetical protein